MLSLIPRAPKADPVTVGEVVHPRPDRKRPPATPGVRAGGGIFCDMTSRKRSGANTENQTPDEQTPDEQTPDEQTPDEQTPDEQTPDEQTPDEQTPDDSVPDADDSNPEPLTDDELAEALSRMSRDDLIAMQSEAFRVSTLIAAELTVRPIDHAEGF